MPAHHSSRSFRHIGLILAVLTAVSSVQAFAQDILDDRSESGATKRYLLQLTGNVDKQSFQNATAVLELSPAPVDALYPYIITIQGWPIDNDFNTFSWNSKESEMESLSTRVRCRMSNALGFKGDIHFYYLSPTLFKNKGTVNQHEKERIRQTKKVALPTMIFAQTGELTLNFVGSMVTGEVSMSGYDSIGHEYVRYYAHVQGSLNRGITSRHRIWKND